MVRSFSLGEIKWDGLDEYIKELDKNYRRFESEIIKEMNKFKAVPYGGAVKLSPRDERDLEKSWTTSNVKREGASYSFSIGTNKPYAAWLHERNPKQGTVRNKYDRGALVVGYYRDGWGLRTRRKPEWRGYKPGNKFLENAVQGSKPEYDMMNERLLRIMTGG